MAKKSAPQSTSYGGQALIEGVMMNGPDGYNMAARLDTGEIVQETDKHTFLREKYSFFGWPIIRGVVSFVESMALGIKALTWSAQQSGEEDEKLEKKDMVLAVILALIITIVFFVALPVWLGSFTRAYIGGFGRSLVEGLFRVGLFVGYVAIISKMPDMARTFAYHGAEHKTINAYEAGVPLTVDNVRKYSRIHTRCGTSFILMSLLLMIIVFTFVGDTTPIKRILIKVVTMPIVAGLAYELFRLPLKFPNSKLVNMMVTPGLWLQRLTTKEPDNSQIAVGIAALNGVPNFVVKAPIDISTEDSAEKTKESLNLAEPKEKDLKSKRVAVENIK